MTRIHFLTKQYNRYFLNMTKSILHQSLSHDNKSPVYLAFQEDFFHYNHLIQATESHILDPQMVLQVLQNELYLNKEHRYAHHLHPI